MSSALKTTPSHPFWVVKDSNGRKVNSYIPASELEIGFQLGYEDGENKTSESSSEAVIQIDYEQLLEPEPVYNLCVDDYENFYVAPASNFSPRTGRMRFLKVHNCSAALDFMPIVGSGKGFLEAAIGQDLVTGQELEVWERCLAAGAIIPGTGPIVKKIASSVKTAAEINKDARLVQNAKKLEHLASKSMAGNSNSIPRYHGPKPDYHVNPAHVKGSPQFNPRKTPLPSDASEVFKRAVPDNGSNARHWYGKNKEGVTYRFSNANDGTVHFSGRSDIGDGVRNLTPYAKQRLKDL